MREWTEADNERENSFTRKPTDQSRPDTTTAHDTTTVAEDEAKGFKGTENLEILATERTIFLIFLT
jgi:hypothetical protein